MKPMRLALVGAIAAVAACVPRPEPAPPAAPPVRPAPPVARPAPPPPPPAASDWRDIPLSPGSWSYRDEGAASQAVFGPLNGEASFLIRCERGSRLVTLSRAGAPAGTMMTLRTTSTAGNLPVSPQTQPLPRAVGTLPASDRLLDAIAFSRGRFTVELTGTAMLVIPSWPEPARVVEDCRG
jgi:hypothetical protein